MLDDDEVSFFFFTLACAFVNRGQTRQVLRDRGTEAL